MVAFQRGSDGADPVRGAGGPHHVEQRIRHTTLVATGTFACPHCDAPIPPHVPIRPVALMICPYCLRSGRARDFLSLDAPSRPARVEVRIVPR
jgi:hypothetical protein